MYADMYAGDNRIRFNLRSRASHPARGWRRSGRARFHERDAIHPLELASNPGPGFSQRLLRELIAPRLTVVIATRSSGRDEESPGIREADSIVYGPSACFSTARGAQIRDTLARFLR